MANIVELRDEENERLQAMLEDARKEMFSLRFQRASGQLEDYSRLRAARREIAQLETVLRMRQLAIEAALTTPEIADAVNELEEWDAEAHFDYESSQWQVDFVDDRGEPVASALVNLNKKKPKSKKKTARVGQVKLVTSYEVMG